MPFSFSKKRGRCLMFARSTFQGFSRQCAVCNFSLVPAQISGLLRFATFLIFLLRFLAGFWFVALTTSVLFLRRFLAGFSEKSCGSMRFATFLLFLCRFLAGFCEAVADREISLIYSRIFLGLFVCNFFTAACFFFYRHSR